ATIPRGAEAKIDVLRKGKAMSFTVKAIAPPDKPARNAKVLSGQHLLSGVEVSNINPAVAVEQNLTNEMEGVVVTGVAEGRRVSRVMRAGDIVVSFNGESISSVSALEKELEK